MVTKEQERKALEKIRKIIEELGEDSYIGTAFEGCCDLAEQNIIDDAAYSMKGEAQRLADENWQRRKEIGELKNRITGLETINENLNKQVAMKSERIDELNKHLEDAGNQWTETWNAFREQEDRAEVLEQEVIKLKAKLYDLITK